MMHVGRVASLLVLLRSATGIPTTLHTLDSAAAMQRGLQEAPGACVSVRSCEELAASGGGWPTGRGDAAICAESDAGFADGCVQDGWTQAQATCFEAGARLCTVDEIVSGETQGTGCSHDNRQVWSSTGCAEGQGMQTALGRGARDATCQPDLTTLLAIRCCADVEAVRQGAFSCDIYGAGRSDCTSALSCAELVHRDGDNGLGAWPAGDSLNPLGSPEVCGESDAGFGPAFTRQCYNAESWADAYQICVRAGARLCNVEEVSADETRGTGCSHDTRTIWTSDDVGCQPGEHVQAPGSVTCANCAVDGWDATVPACRPDADPGAVRCCADAVVGTPCELSAPENLDQLPGVTVTLGNTVETDTDLVVPPGDPRCAPQGCGFRGGSAPTIVDMSHAPDEWTSSPFGDSPDCSTRLYVTVDLGQSYPVDGVTIWHYHGDDRSYCGQKVALSATGQFLGEELTVFDTARGYGPTETEQGNAIAFETTAARYVRHWCGRSDQNSGIHFMEIDIYGMAVPQSTRTHASLPDKVLDLPFLGDAVDHSTFSRAVTLVGDSQPTASGMHFDGDGDWITVESFDYASDASFSINFWLRKGDCTGNAWEMLFSDASTPETIPYNTQFAYAAANHASWIDLYIGCDPQRDSTKVDGTVPGGSIMRAWMMDATQTMAVFDYALHEAGQFDEITRAWTSVTYTVSPTAVVTHTDGSRAAVADYSFVSGFVNDPEGYGTRLPNAAYPNPQALVSPFSRFNLLGNNIVIGNRNDATLTREFSGKIALFALFDVTLTDAECTDLFFRGETNLMSLGPELPVIPPSCVSLKSCEELTRVAGRGSWPTGRGDPDVCAESDAGIDGGCTQDGWLEAQATCYEVGARLCTIEEIGAGETQGTGCSHDSRQVWSSSLCNAADGVGRQTALGRDGSQAQCQRDLSVSAAIRCCADMEQIRLTKSPCDLFASEESDCTSVLSCDQLAERDGNSWPTQNGNAAVCGESDAGLGEGFARQCFDAQPWSRAHNICVGAGARLCTVEELHADETKGTGCSLDLEMVWSINDIGCNSHEHVMVPGATQCDGCDPYATPRCALDESDGAVRCCADAVVGTPCELEPVENLDQLPGVTVTLGNTVETDTDLVVPPGDPRCAPQGCGFRGGSAPTIVDMSHAPDEWTSSPFGDSPDCSTRLYATIDLQENYPVTGVTLWHYHGDDRSYCGQKVALSATGQFQGEEVVVYETGQLYGDKETERGKAIVFDRIVARYVRHWSSRSDRNTGIHFMEIDVYGSPVPAHPLDLCPAGANLVEPLGGTATAGQQCVFPFTYEGRVYNACTDVNYEGTPWCSVDTEYTGNWGVCECTGNFHAGMCGIDTGLVTTTGGTAAEGSACVFPFEYEGVSYNSCTHAGCTGAGCSHWCSTTDVYSDQWGNCVCSPTDLGPAGRAACANLPDGAACETDMGVSGTCHGLVCESISWTRRDNQDCSKFVPETAHGPLMTLADAEAACRAQRNCGGVADANCDGATGTDTFRLCLGARTRSDEATCMWPAPPQGGGH